jgi:hypothetical protein
MAYGTQPRLVQPSHPVPAPLCASGCGCACLGMRFRFLMLCGHFPGVVWTRGSRRVAPTVTVCVRVLGRAWETIFCQCELLKSLGADATVDYKGLDAAGLATALAAACPAGAPPPPSTHAHIRTIRTRLHAYTCTHTAPPGAAFMLGANITQCVCAFLLPLAFGGHGCVLLWGSPPPLQALTATLTTWAASPPTPWWSS